MFRKTTALFLLVGLAGCTAGTSGPDDQTSISTCEGGKCDAFAPRALETISTAFGQCTVTPDTSTQDEFFAVETVECRFIDFDESAGTTINSIILEARELATEQYHSARFDELDGTTRSAFNFRTDGYPLRIEVRPIVHMNTTYSQLSAPQQHGEYLLPRITTEVLNRPTEPVTLDFELPMELWEVVVWPTKEFAEKLASGEHRFGLLKLTSELEVDGNAERVSHSRSFRPGDDLTQLSNTVFVLPSADIVLAELHATSEQPTGLVAIDGPGYFLIEADGSLTAATPQDIEARGMFADDAEPPVVVDNPGEEEEPPITDPVDPPEQDACAGACDATEACVASACVPLEDQRQRSCNSAATAVCEEDADCASGNVCADGLCRLRECQIQYTSCSTPTAVCDADSDCADDHACAEGLCRRLSCQVQYTSCSNPHTVCEQTSDCAAEHACVEGACRRLSCQLQYTSCSTPHSPCGANDHCSADHACVEGLCRRLSCQIQYSSCSTPSAPCAADGDCASGHACLDDVCQRLSCID